jgi:hypothetical protein
MRPDTNLMVIKRSRHKPERGDIFVMQLPSGEYLFGRVVLADLPRERAPVPGANLIYIYDIVTSDKLVPRDLVPQRLLIPPIFTNALGWVRGYFETLEKRQIRKEDLLARHCFRRWTGDYVDERGNALAMPIGSCGTWGLASYREVDDLVSDALGIPRVPVSIGDVAETRRQRECPGRRPE